MIGMFTDLRRKFLFKCEDCELILSVDFENEQDLLDVQDDKVVLECPCGSKCFVLRD